MSYIQGALNEPGKDCCEPQYGNFGYPAQQYPGPQYPPQYPSAGALYPDLTPQYPCPTPQYPNPGPQYPVPGPQYPGPTPQYLPPTYPEPQYQVPQSQVPYETGNSHLTWVGASNGYIPINAVLAGGGIFVARGFFAGETIPGKVSHGHQQAYISYGGQEHKLPNYELLVHNGTHIFGGYCYAWERSHSGQVPSRAILGGYTVNNEPLYIAKGTINGNVCVGKMCPSHGCAFFPFGGTEHRLSHYEILCSR